MTKTEIYGKLYAYLQAHGEAGKIEKPQYYTKTTPESMDYLAELCRKLQDDIRAEVNKNKGNGNVEKGMLSVLKQDTRPVFNGFFKCGEGLAVCSHCVLLRTFEKIEAGELIEGLEHAEHMIICAKEKNNQKLQTPEISKLKSYIKIEKAKKQKGDPKGVSYDFGEGLPLVNAEFLINILTAIPDAELFYAPGNLCASLYFEGSKGDGLIMPIRRQQ